jgi:excisionase family DNA binding protein
VTAPTNRPPARPDVTGPGRPAPDDRRATYTVAEIAEIMGISRGAVYAELRAGNIPALRCGTRWVIPRRRFHAWFDGEQAVTR